MLRENEKHIRYELFNKNSLANCLKTVPINKHKAPNVFILFKKYSIGKVEITSPHQKNKNKSRTLIQTKIFEILPNVI